jgi:hypothetical protein
MQRQVPGSSRQRLAAGGREQQVRRAGQQELSVLLDAIDDMLDGDHQVGGALHLVDGQSSARRHQGFGRAQRAVQGGQVVQRQVAAPSSDGRILHQGGLAHLACAAEDHNRCARQGLAQALGKGAGMSYAFLSRVDICLGAHAVGELQIVM